MDIDIDDEGRSDCEAVIALYLEDERIDLRDLAYMCYLKGIKEGK